MTEQTIRAQHARMAAALRAIVALYRDFDGDTEERYQNDMEDAFNNGIEVGQHDGYRGAAAIARTALQGVPKLTPEYIEPADVRTVDQICAVLWDRKARDWRELNSCADAIQDVCLILGSGERGRK